MTAQLEEPSPILKRSFSTPTVRDMAQDSPTTAGEKKRNKLGYHRTSIACSESSALPLPRASRFVTLPSGSSGFWSFAQVTAANQGRDTTGHCRRRKIRCIVSSEIQNRCINCIRLKKDCSFCPVDQQPTVDSQGKSAGQGTGGSAAHSQSSSPAPASGHPAVIASRHVYGTGMVQDSVGLVAPVIVPSSGAFASVADEEIGLSIPMTAEQSFNVSPGSSLAWRSTQPSPVTIPGSMDMGFAWHPYGSESSSTEQLSSLGPGSASQSTWAEAASGTPQLNDWNWNNVALAAAQARSVSFSGDFISQSHQQFASLPGNSLYNGVEPTVEGTYTSPMDHSLRPGHLPSQAGEPSISWLTQQQQMLLQQPQQQSMGFESWGFPNTSGPAT
ncbi:C6 finger domain protein [Beauveria bassiana ARSEF 2860]|uniref:C6 finger domain protein n=1 Tax=Beauveria bassiana (strain ARSEF 2860) TaxID=655819 RepID=J5JFI8_BEAB2|nr:C6 finger domain protein [Beauveria bassiana ARSEF 2860]EJP64558.1 C6 finger domain protein [Beauveria bassiana ARSEF 2860]